MASRPPALNNAAFDVGSMPVVELMSIVVKASSMSNTFHACMMLRMDPKGHGSMRTGGCRRKPAVTDKSIVPNNMVIKKP